MNERVDIHGDMLEAIEVSSSKLVVDFWDRPCCWAEIWCEQGCPLIVLVEAISIPL